MKGGKSPRELSGIWCLSVELNQLELVRLCPVDDDDSQLKVTLFAVQLGGPGTSEKLLLCPEVGGRVKSRTQTIETHQRDRN